MKIKEFLVLNFVLIMIIISCTADPSSSKNTKPIADFTVNPDSGNTATIFAFNANSSYDKENYTSELKIRWDWENDGVWDTDYSTIKNLIHQYTIEGTYIIALEVMDTDELTDATTKEITVSKVNTPPSASFTVNPTNGNVNDVFYFDASSSHDDEDDISDLKVRWDWENDGIWDLDYTISKTATHQFAVEGYYLTKLEVKDSNGWSNSVIHGILVERQSIVVTIIDSSFEELLRLQLNNTSEDITDIDLEDITTLNGDGWNISDISGIEYCLNLQKLDLRNNYINNIYALNGLLNLQNLTLSNNQLSDINSISGLVNLQVLGLSENTISNIESLKNLLNLRQLYLSDNQISNINPLINLISIKDLDLSDNQIVDIYPLIQNAGIDSGDIITLIGNPLNDTSINTYIPQLESTGVKVYY